MSKFLFNNRSFPISASKEEVIAHLINPEVRAVALRKSRAVELVQKIRAGAANFIARPEIMAEFMPDKIGNRAKYPGQKAYDSALTTDNVIWEAQNAGILLGSGIAEELTDTMNGLRQTVTAVYQDMSGDKDSPVIGHILMVPKGIAPRAAMPHVDDVPITGHFSSAPLDILTEEPDAALWDALNKPLRSSLPYEEQERVLRWLADNTKEWQDNYLYSSPGDSLIMKGQKGRNLREIFHQKQVCVHKSTNLLPLLGQIGFVCYPKLENPEFHVH